MIFFTPFKRQCIVILGNGDTVRGMGVEKTELGNTAVIEFGTRKVAETSGSYTIVTKKDMKDKKRLKLAFLNPEVIDFFIEDLTTLKEMLSERNKTDD